MDRMSFTETSRYSPGLLLHRCTRSFHCAKRINPMRGPLSGIRLSKCAKPSEQSQEATPANMRFMRFATICGVTGSKSLGFMWMVKLCASSLSPDGFSGSMLISIPSALALVAHETIAVWRPKPVSCVWIVPEDAAAVQRMVAATAGRCADPCREISNRAFVPASIFGTKRFAFQPDSAARSEEADPIPCPREWNAAT